MIHQIHCPRCQFFQQVDDTRVMPCQKCGLMLAAAPPAAVPVAEVVERGNFGQSYGHAPVPPKTPRWMIWTLVGAVVFFLVVTVGTFAWAVSRSMKQQQANMSQARQAKMASVANRNTQQTIQAQQQLQQQRMAEVQRQVEQQQNAVGEQQRQARERMEAQRKEFEAGRQAREAARAVPLAERAAIAEKTKKLDLSEYDAHWSVQGKVSDNLVSEMAVPLDADGIAVLRAGLRMRTRKLYPTPVTFRIVGQTDSTNFRFRYAADQIILNWEGNREELRIDGGPANGRHKAGAGAIPVKQWVAIEFTVTKTEMIIRVDGQERFRTSADFSKSNHSLQIWGMGSVVKVKSVQVVEPDNTPVEQ